MTLAEIYREEGKLQGIQQGIQEGETRALAKTAIRLLTKIWNPSTRYPGQN